MVYGINHMHITNIYSVYMLFQIISPNANKPMFKQSIVLKCHKHITFTEYITYMNNKLDLFRGYTVPNSFMCTNVPVYNFF